jgi:hypothetical protein
MIHWRHRGGQSVKESEVEMWRFLLILDSLYKELLSADLDIVSILSVCPMV